MLNQDKWFVSGDDLLLTIMGMLDNGVPIDLTGCTVVFQIKRTVDSTVLVNKATMGSGINIIDPLKGVIEVELTHTDTAPLEGKYVYELKITDTNGRIKRLRESNGSLATITFNKKLIS